MTATQDPEPEVVGADRLSMNLIPQAAADLAAIQKKTHYNKTDVVTRALAMYAFFIANMKPGSRVLMQTPVDERPDGSYVMQEETVRFI